MMLAALIPGSCDPRIVQDRLTACMLCPRYVAGVCRDCGCVMVVKARIAAASCPQGKWHAQA